MSDEGPSGGSMGVVVGMVIGDGHNGDESKDALTSCATPPGV